MTSTSRPSVLFICLGNICRSPIAEALFLDLIEKKGERDMWKIDSAAIGDWHIGLNPDPRTMKTLKKNGITSYKHKVRQIRNEDFTDFNYIIGMDHTNLSDLNDMKPDTTTAELVMFGKHDTQDGSDVIEDPYYEPKVQFAQMSNAAHGSLVYLLQQSMRGVTILKLLMKCMKKFSDAAKDSMTLSQLQNKVNH